MRQTLPLQSPSAAALAAMRFDDGRQFTRQQQQRGQLEGARTHPLADLQSTSSLSLVFARGAAATASVGWQADRISLGASQPSGCLLTQADFSVRPERSRTRWRLARRRQSRRRGLGRWVRAGCGSAVPPPSPPPTPWPADQPALRGCHTVKDNRTVRCLIERAPCFRHCGKKLPTSPARPPPPLPHHALACVRSTLSLGFARAHVARAR